MDLKFEMADKISLSIKFEILKAEFGILMEKLARKEQELKNLTSISDKRLETEKSALLNRIDELSIEITKFKAENSEKEGFKMEMFELKTDNARLNAKIRALEDVLRNEKENYRETTEAKNNKISDLQVTAQKLYVEL